MQFIEAQSNLPSRNRWRDRADNLLKRILKEAGILSLGIRGKPHFVTLLLLLLIVYSYVFVQLFKSDWSEPESGHGPLVLILALWLLYRKWDEKNVAPELGVWRTAGIFTIFLLAAALYIVGLVGEISQFSYGSIVPFLIASILLFQSRNAKSGLALPVLFICFSIPLPLFIVVPVTLPMKQLVAEAAEQLLRIGGYPVARSGVILYLGPYQLQVADACAGLRTLFTLEALGLLYLILVESKSLVRNVILAVLVFPIAMLANTIRVILLCLITYYLGDAAGQGFIHGFAGIALFVCALLLMLASDSALRVIVARRKALPMAS
jgi:exosortase B